MKLLKSGPPGPTKSPMGCTDAGVEADTDSIWNYFYPTPPKIQACLLFTCLAYYLIVPFCVN